MESLIKKLQQNDRDWRVSFEADRGRNFACANGSKGWNWADVVWRKEGARLYQLL